MEAFEESLVVTTPPRHRLGSPNILQAKRHHVVAIHTSGCDECSVFQIEGMLRDLVIARVCVKEG